VPSILAALHRKSRTAEGCYIDVAQAEAGIQFVAPAYYEYAANGTIPARRGYARSPLRCPHGVYQSAGDDRWIVIDASRDEHWRALREIVAGALLDPKFDLLIGRLRSRDEIDRALGEWTRSRDAEETERILQRAGVPAHIVSRAGDLARDSHLRAANHFKKIEDPEFGEAEIEGPRFWFERTKLPETRRGPRIGEHTKEVLTTVLRLSDAEIADLAESGVLK
jgi:benzylsuccinate CoA-transferase BbsF subunit